MKKDKRLQMLLLGLVVVIWGAIVYQFSNYNASDNIDFTNGLDTTPIVSLLEEKQDSFGIVVDYRDPFLGKRIKAAYDGPRRPAAPSSGTLNPPTNAAPPNIIYQGYSINNNQITRVRVSLNGKTYTMQPNDKKDQLVLKKMAKDSILVNWEGKPMVIHRRRNG